MRGKKRDGFSLLELLTVVAIVSMLSMLAVTGYFGAVRAMARRSAVKHLVDTLTLARQRACLEGGRMSVLLFNETASYEGSEAVGAPSYVVCRELGRVSGTAEGRPYDEFTSLDRMFDVLQSEVGAGEGGASAAKSETSYGGAYSDSRVDEDRRFRMRLFNLRSGKWVKVRPLVEKVTGLPINIPQEMKTGASRPPVYWFVGGERDSGSVSWEAGDPYGIETTPVNSLPKGFYFDGLDPKAMGGGHVEDGKNIHIVFNPDGTALDAKKIVIIESLSRKQVSVDVDRKGAISYTTWQGESKKK